MAATGDRETGRGPTARPGGKGAAGTLDSKGMHGPKAGAAAVGTDGDPAAPVSGRTVPPSPRLSPDLPLSPGLKERVLEAVRDVRPEAGANRAGTRPPLRKASGLRHWLSWACAAAAGLALAFSVGNQRRLDREITAYRAGLVDLAGEVRELQSRLDQVGGAPPFPNDPDVRALLLLGTPKSPEARGAVFWSVQERKARLYTSRLPQLSREKTYQLWLIADKPVGAGTFRVDPAGQGYLEVVDLDRESPPVQIAVTMEPAGGARQLTGEVYLTGSY